MNNPRILSFILFFAITFTAYTQNIEKKNYFPIWTFHQDSINIHGVSVGLWTINKEPKYTNTNGIKFELIGIGILFPLIPSSPIAINDSAFIKIQQKPLSEKINGLNLSLSGTYCHCLTNGLTAGSIGQINYQVNGVSTSLVMNFSQIHNGLMISLFNEAYYINGLQIGLSNIGFKTNGIQIGLFNKSKKMKGIQIGLWNVNGKRKFPIVNWNFKHE